MASQTIPLPRVRTSGRRFGLRAGLGVGLLLGVGLTIAWRGRPASPAPVAVPDWRELDSALLSAVRAGDQATVQSLLDQGADVQARDETGDTALMRATLHASTDVMRLLLHRGADVNARGVYEVPALLRAVHDPEKVELLLGHGARVDERSLVIAAMVPGSRKTLERLWLRGGDVNAAVGGYTPLMAAAYSGDLEAVTWLLEHGARANARTDAGCTALHGAALCGNAAIVKLLLERGADPNGRYVEPDSVGDLQTPVLNAAGQGHAACLKLLLEQGAEVNVQGGPFQRTPLLVAATTGSEETVRLLLAHGANVQARDARGATPLAWARRRGETAIVRLLRQAQGVARSPGDVAPSRRDEPPSEQPRMASRVAVARVRAAVAASLPLVQRSGQKITQTRGCITCHQHALVALTVGLARKHGFAVDEEIAAGERSQVRAVLGRRLPLLLLGADVDPTLVAYTLVGLAAEEQEPDALTDALVHYLVLHQQPDGHWQPEAYRPPEDGSPFLFTALAVRGLQAYASPGRRREIAGRIARARGWLLQAQPAETVDRVFQLLGLAWAGVGAKARQQAADLLLRQQRPDGGWAQLPTLASDAYATGQVLFALHEAGGIPVDAPAYRRGVDFLLRAQRPDGSWFVPTRCFPALVFSSSGFPHGRSQFISAAATCWATLALVQTIPRPERSNSRLNAP